MNPEVKAKWLEALRSGEYEQTTGMLRSRDNKFCCLGVLTDLAIREGVVPQWKPSDAGDYYHCAGNYELTPQKVADWAGMMSRNESIFFVEGDGTERDLTLAEMNDGGCSFAEIADAIEDQL